MKSSAAAKILIFKDKRMSPVEKNQKINVSTIICKL